MKSTVKNSGLLLLGLLALTACRRNDSSTTPSTAAVPAVAPQTTNWSHEEIFRRAFWRQPTAADRIIHAERNESVLGTAVTNATSRDIQTWSWFIELHPGPDLLAALRDPDTLGLRATTAPRPWAASTDTPPWFPAHSALASSTPSAFEILQNPAAGLTVLYRAHDNTLFATDTGGGFAPPAR